VAAGLELISSVGIFLISRQVASSQSTYGVLGVAATLLVGLYLVGRLIVTSAVINATIRERRLADADPSVPAGAISGSLDTPHPDEPVARRHL
jgi:uncharacterized BrkB/YihY/UPF0761 family membrane protein